MEARKKGTLKQRDSIQQMLRGRLRARLPASRSPESSPPLPPPPPPELRSPQLRSLNGTGSLSPPAGCGCACAPVRASSM